MNTAAFFDLDRTLIDVNSATLWAKYEFRSGNIGPSQLARVAFWNVLYHLSVVDIESAFEKAVLHYKGVAFEDLRKLTHDWFAREVEHRIRPGARKALDAHKTDGHHLVILTSASCFEAEIASQRWGVPHYLANRFPTDAAGKLTGDFERPLCYGRGKIHHATRWAEEHGVDLKRSYFYSDSFTDLPMLEAVGHPHVVDPDPRLKREALRRHWPIVDWSR